MYDVCKLHLSLSFLCWWPSKVMLTHHLSMLLTSTYTIWSSTSPAFLRHFAKFCHISSINVTHLGIHFMPYSVFVWAYNYLTTDTTLNLNNFQIIGWFFKRFMKCDGDIMVITWQNTLNSLTTGLIIQYMLILECIKGHMHTWCSTKFPWISRLLNTCLRQDRSSFNSLT